MIIFGRPSPQAKLDGNYDVYWDSEWAEEIAVLMATNASYAAACEQLSKKWADSQQFFHVQNPMCIQYLDASYADKVAYYDKEGYLVRICDNKDLVKKLTLLGLGEALLDGDWAI